MLIVAINGEEPITDQGVLDELICHQNPQVKSKVKISLCRKKIYLRTYLEEIWYRFDQVIPVFSHLEIRLSDKSLTPNNIGEALILNQRQLWKEASFVKYNNNKIFSLLSAPISIKFLSAGTKVLCSIIDQSNK